MNKSKVVHIVYDEKFIDDAHFIFDQVDDISNTFIIIGDPKPLKYIKSTPIKFVNERDLLNYLLEIDLIFFHSLILSVLPYINQLKIKKKVEVHWIGFGFDYYKYFIFHGDNVPLFKEFTYGLIGAPKPRFGVIGKFLFSLKRSYQVRNIDYFLPVLETEYHLVKKKNLFFKPKFKDWNYGYLGKIIPEVDKVLHDSNKYILLGNSASPSNNHIDSLELFKQRIADYQNYAFVIPLSYGDDEYKNKLKEYLANTDFQYQLLEDFMPLVDYNNFLKKCKNVIMPHLRQQGLGNILTMMMYGANIFLYKENPLYPFFKDRGVHVLDLEQINTDILQSIQSNEQYEINRTFIHQHWGFKNILKKTNELFD